MDMSLTGYILLLVSLVLAIGFWFEGKALSRFFKYFTFILLLVFSFILVADLELYRNWGYRIDTTPLIYLKTPGDAMASLNYWVVFMLVFLFCLIVLGFHFLFSSFAFNGFKNMNKGKWWIAPIFLFIAATTIIPIRGGFGIAPMNPGKVYFSSNTFSNHAALNGIWNLLYSASKSGDMYKKYPKYLDDAEAKFIGEFLHQKSNEIEPVLKSNKPNVVIILLESFTSKLIEPLGGVKGITPNFNRYANEGLLFKNIYASGDRSDKGLVAVISGFPAQSTQSIIKFPLKSKKLASLSCVFDSIGYSTFFYYGGDADFANMRTYLYSAKFNKIITQDNFPRTFRNSKWGVHDEFLFKQLITDIDSAKGPFFKFIFTLSSHEPFDIPSEPIIKGNDDESKFLSSVNYTDKWLGWFFDEAKQRSWYDNTLFILIADHGHRLPGNNPIYDPNKFRIPMLWLGGALDSIGVVNRMGSQTDLAATLLNQLNIESKSFLFSRNLLSPKSRSFAYYAFNDGFGFIMDSTILIWDHTSQKPIVTSTDSCSVNNGFGYFSHYHKYFLGL
jgi:phosphoglycerol transferase MdoB-like AlkP superfamily enzyme